MEFKGVHVPLRMNDHFGDPELSPHHPAQFLICQIRWFLTKYLQN